MNLILLEATCKKSGKLIKQMTTHFSIVEKDKERFLEKISQEYGTSVENIQNKITINSTALIPPVYVRTNDSCSCNYFATFMYIGTKKGKPQFLCVENTDDNPDSILDFNPSSISSLDNIEFDVVLNVEQNNLFQIEKSLLNFFNEFITMTQPVFVLNLK